MAELIAWILYGVGFLAVASSPLDYPARDSSPPIRMAISLAAALAWPILALVMIFVRAAASYLEDHRAGN